MNPESVLVGGSPQAATPPPPTRWGANMTVEHRITGERGTVLRIDFDEAVVSVDCPDYEAHWRVENVFEVAS